MHLDDGIELLDDASVDTLATQLNLARRLMFDEDRFQFLLRRELHKPSNVEMHPIYAGLLERSQERLDVLSDLQDTLTRVLRAKDAKGETAVVLSAVPNYLN